MVKKRFLARYDGKDVFVKDEYGTWCSLEKDLNCSCDVFKDKRYKFRLKPQNISLNNKDVDQPIFIQNLAGSALVLRFDSDEERDTFEKALGDCWK